MTDYWTRGRRGIASIVPGREAAKASQRFHPDLANAAVMHMGTRRILFETLARIRRSSGWDTITRRNALFQRIMIHQLRKGWLRELRSESGIFFSYSYAALDLLRFFRELGWRTVLGQMDPGIHEEEIVAAEQARHPDLPSHWSPAPGNYWNLWREECALSDRIVVNSEWSREALLATGVASEKIMVVPLAYERTPNAVARAPVPPAFTEERPLCVLFLGQLTLRKGVHLALDAARQMRDEPVRWCFVGPGDMEFPNDLQGSPRIHWSGPVSRDATRQLYGDADLFLLPTLSDGFALTQLEAQAAGLPVIASKFCGDVVRDGVNGWIIDPLTSSAIVERMRCALKEPVLLRLMSGASSVHARFSLDALGTNLEQIERELSTP